MSVVGQLFEHFLSRRSRHVTVVVGTSGDTGSAALQGRMSGRESRVRLFSPALVLA